jgi:hypothetical protein
MPSPSVEETNRAAHPEMDAAAHKKARDDQAKMNQERMEEMAKSLPTPSVAESNLAAGAVPIESPVAPAVPQPDEPDEVVKAKTRAASAEGHDASYKTRASAKESK